MFHPSEVIRSTDHLWKSWVPNQGLNKPSRGGTIKLLQWRTLKKNPPLLTCGRRDCMIHASVGKHKLYPLGGGVYVVPSCQVNNCWSPPTYSNHQHFCLLDQIWDETLCICVLLPDILDWIFFCPHVHSEYLARCWIRNNELLFGRITGTGITTHKQTRWASWIMMATLLPYVVAQIPRLLGLETEGHLCIAIAACIAFAQLIAYCVYQVRRWLTTNIVNSNRFTWIKRFWTETAHLNSMVTKSWPWHRNWISIILVGYSSWLLGFRSGRSIMHSSDGQERKDSSDCLIWHIKMIGGSL